MPCEINWAVELPLNPTVADAPTEVPIRGMIAMATNGVPAYGAQVSNMLMCFILFYSYSKARHLLMNPI